MPLLIYLLLGIIFLLPLSVGFFTVKGAVAEWKRVSLFRLEGRTTTGYITEIHEEKLRVHTGNTSYDRTSYSLAFTLRCISFLTAFACLALPARL
jgi:hypothetical protein